MNKKNIEIEYLRAIAIAMTMLGHLPILFPFYEKAFVTMFTTVYLPWTGVDLFFCISGYVVSKAYMEVLDRQREAERFSLAAQGFWIRRIYRLLPTAWLWIFIPLGLSICFNRSGLFGTWQENLRSFTAVATFTGNIANQFNLTLGPNSVYWSLALEEQFYFMFPLFLLFVRTSAKRISVLLTLIVVQFFIGRNPFGTPFAALAASFRLDGLMWGILIYMFSHFREYRTMEPVFLKGSLAKPLAITLLLVYLLGAIPAHMIAMPIAVGLIAIVSAILVFLASFDSGYIPRIPFISNGLEWMGSRSYGMYVIHITAYRLANEIWSRVAEARGVPPGKMFAREMFLTAVVLLVVLSELTYRLVEQPLRRRGAAIAAQRLEMDLDAGRIPGSA